MDNSFQNSTIAQILEAIIEQLTFEGESTSDIADILLSILNQTPYNKEPDSVIAELLIKLKAKIEGESFDPYDKAYTSNIAEIIVSILEETEYKNQPQSRIAELLLELKAELESYIERTASGHIANFITSIALPLVNIIVDNTATKVYQRGENLWNEITELGNLDATTGEPTPDNSRLRSKDFSECVGGLRYYLKKGGEGTIRVFYYDSNYNLIRYYGWNAGNVIIDVPENTKFFKIVLATAYGTTYNDDISINYLSSDTEYHAYNGRDYDIANINNIDTFVGVNNLFADNGDISVTYKTKATDELSTKSNDIKTSNSLEDNKAIEYDDEKGTAKRRS